MNIKNRLEKLEKEMGEGKYEVLTHEGFITGSGMTKRVSKQEYDEHQLQLKALA